MVSWQWTAYILLQYIEYNDIAIHAHECTKREEAHVSFIFFKKE